VTFRTERLEELIDGARFQAPESQAAEARDYVALYVVTVVLPGGRCNAALRLVELEELAQESLNLEIGRLLVKPLPQLMHLLLRLGRRLGLRFGHYGPALPNREEVL
jgi:hypothetical protein